MLDRLAELQQRVAQAGGRIQVCSLVPLLRDLLRIRHLDRALDVCADEAEELALILP